MFQLCNMSTKEALRVSFGTEYPFRDRSFFRRGAVIIAAAAYVIAGGAECRAETEIITTAPVESRAIAGTGSPGEKHTSLNQPICDDDEYVLMAVGDNYAEIYDDQGNYISKCRTYMDSGYDAYTIRKDYVLEYSDDKDCNVFSMADLENILTFPSDQYIVMVNGDIVLATELETGNFSLYDNHGNILYKWDGNTFIPDGSSADSTAANGRCQGRIVTMDSGYLIGTVQFADDGNILTGGPVWISKDHKESREISDSYLRQEFADWTLEGFGDYVMIYDWNTESGGVYDLDGNLLLDQVVSHFSEYTDDNWFCPYNSGDYFRISLVMQSGDEMCSVYNTKLEECAMVPVTEEGYWDYGYAGSFIKGASYQQLDGRKCDGFVQYKASSWCPYAETEEGTLIYADGEKILIPYEQGNNITSLNEAYEIAGYYSEGYYTDRLISRKTGEILAESSWNEDGSVYFSLGTDYCIITEDSGSEEDYRTSMTIMDSEDKVCYTGDNDRARTWKNGYIVLNRGIYHGIADINGNWIVKTISGWSE